MQRRQTGDKRVETSLFHLDQIDQCLSRKHNYSNPNDLKKTACQGNQDIKKYN
jgi:hypothetical protein